MFFSVCRVGAAGPPEMDIPECVEDSMQWARFKKVFRPEVAWASCAIHRYHQSVMVLIGQIVPE
jgi:hypothetical protein